MTQAYFPVVILLGLAVMSPAKADQIVVSGVNYANAKVTGLEQGKLQFRTADGGAFSAWIDEVQLMLVDRGGVFDDFNQAEQFLHDGDPLKAIARYERTLRLTQEFWADLIACRLAAAHDLARQIDRASQYFVRVAHGEFSGLPAAARLYPRNIPDKRDARVARALDLLADESRKASDDAGKVLIEILRFDVLARTDTTAARPLARTIAELTVPAAARNATIYGVVLRAMQMVMKDFPGSLGLSAVDRALRDCPEDIMPGFLMVKGQLLFHAAQSREQFIHAAWTFLRIPIHMPDHSLAPQALIEAARAVQKLERPEQAKTLFAEARIHPKATPEIRKAAEQEQGEAKTPQPSQP